MISEDEVIEEFETQMGRSGLSGRVSVVLSSPRRAVISLDNIETDNQTDRRQGLAAMALRMMLRLTDEAGFSVELIPSSLDGCMTSVNLAAWYARNGFAVVPDADPPSTMRRDPKPRST